MNTNIDEILSDMAVLIFFILFLQIVMSLIKTVP